MGVPADLSRHANVKVWVESGIWHYRCPRTFRAFVISQLMEDLAFDAISLAKALGVGDRSFRRLVKESLGIPPGRWLRQQRAVAAARRLQDGCPIKQLALEYGFRHQGDFSVEFKRWHGMGPAEFIRKVTGSL